MGWGQGRWQAAMSFTLAHTPLGPLHVHELLHFMSTGVGMALLAWWYFRWYLSAPVVEIDQRLQPSPLTKLAVPCAMGLVACLAAVAVGLLSVRGQHGQELAREFIMKAVLVGIAALFVQAVVFALLVSSSQRVLAER